MRWAFISCWLIIFAACQAAPPSTPSAWQGRNPVESAPTPEWTLENHNLPTHAPVTALAAEPTRRRAVETGHHTPRKLYAATYDAIGLYTSEDGGATWHADRAKLEPAPVFALLPLPAEMFAGTAAGLYRRAYNAAFWQRADPVPQVAVTALGQDPTGVLYAATDGRGIWKSQDGGTPWSRLPGLDDEPLLSILPLDAQTIFAGTGGRGLLITRDGGRTWQSAPQFSHEYVTFIQLHRPGQIFARARSGLYRSHDRGQTWAKLHGGIEREIVTALLEDSQSERIWAAASGGGIFISDDRGESWRASDVENPRRRAVLSLAQFGDVLLAGTFDGLLQSVDGGETWRVLGHGLGVPIIHDFTRANGRLWVAAEDGLFEQNADGTFVRIPFGAEDVPVSSLAVAPSQPTRIYVGTDGKGVFVSDDGGKTWNAAGGELGGRTRVAQLMVHPTNPEIVFARLLFERIYKSDNGGDDWRAVWTGMPIEEQIQSLAIASNDPAQMWAGGDTQLFSSNNTGETWQARGLSGVSILGLWIDPQDARHVWAGATDGLYISRDAGQSFQGPRLRGLSVTSIVRDAAGTFYLGTKYNGVYRSDDAGKTFVPYGLEGVSVDQLAFDAADNILYALTQQGLYRLAL